MQVDKSGQVHSTADKKVYVRVGAQSILLTGAEQITTLAFSKGAKSFEDYVVPASRMELIVESNAIRSFLADYSPKTDAVDFVVNQQLADFKTWEPTVAGILLFSDQPSANMPRQCAIKIARYVTREDEPERVNPDFYAVLHPQDFRREDPKRIRTCPGLQPTLKGRRCNMLRAFAILLFLTRVVFAEQPTPILPDTKLTPGDTFYVTAEDVCIPGYAKKVRAVPAWLKRQAYAPVRNPASTRLAITKLTT